MDDDDFFAGDEIGDEDDEFADELGSQRPKPADPNAPIKVIVDDLHVIYRVWTAPEQPPQETHWWSRVKARRPVSTRRDVHALRGVSLVARQGEAIGVVGKNGAGKSTLMRAIAGLLPGDQGIVYADGDPTLLGVTSVLMQALSGRRNVELGLLALGLPMSEVKARYDSIVEFSGIGRAIDMPMSTYSSGMSARLKFSIATSVTREILLIDEALSTGDGEFVKRSSERIQRLREEADTIFLVSHSMNAVRNTCNRVIWLDEGRILMDGPTDEVLPAYAERFGLQSRKAMRERRKQRKEANQQAAPDVEQEPG
ncbi:MAG: ABC transporter ATP-binding protein [Candidatus Nanopelagicales bacterium]